MNKVFLSFLVLLSSLILIRGLIPQAIFPFDSFVLVTGAWRVANGLVPYTDFATLYGPAHYYILAATMALTSHSPMALPLSIVVTLVPVSLLAWRATSQRYSPGIAIALATYLTMIWGSSIPLHFLFFESSYAMFENREGYVLVCLILILLLPTPRHIPTTGTDLLVGFLLGIIVFIKLNYAISAGLLVLALVRKQIGVRSLWLGLGFFFSAIPFTLLIGVDGILKMLMDFHHLGVLRSNNWYKDELFIIGIEIPAGIVFLWDLLKQVDSKKINQESIIELAIILLIAASLEFGSYPIAHFLECPLLACYGVILFSKIQWGPLNLQKAFGIGTSLLVISGFSYMNLLLGLCFPFMSHAFYSDRYFETVGSPSYPITTVTLPSKKSGSDNWGAVINDGITLINRHPELGTGRIASLAVTDLFTYPLLRSPVPHTPVWMSFGVNLSLTDYPPPDYILEGADLLMIPKSPEAEFDTFGRIKEYHDYVIQHFDLYGESVNWTLWKRRK